MASSNTMMASVAALSSCNLTRSSGVRLETYGRGAYSPTWPRCGVCKGDEFLTSVLENQSLKAAAAHATDFEVPLYNVWKQQEKTRGSVARSCGNVAGPFAFSVRKYFGNISEAFPSGVGLTERLKQALEDSVADPDRLHQRLFFALCRDLTDFAALANSVEATTILDLVSDYATGEWEAQKPDPFLK